MLHSSVNHSSLSHSSLIHSDLIRLVCEYLPYYKLLEWIDPNKLNIDDLMYNNHALDYLQDMNLITYPEIYRNRSTNIYVRQCKDINEIDSKYLSKNCDIDLIEEHLDKCDIHLLNINCYAVHLFHKYPFLLKPSICRNINAMHIIRPMIKLTTDKIAWRTLCVNENAIDIIEEELKKEHNNIDWESLSFNYNAIHILKANPNKICWNYLSGNSGAMDMLYDNQDKINYKNLSCNKGIFKPTFNKRLYNAMLTLL